MTRSPGTSDSVCPTSGWSTGRAGRTGPSSSSLGPLVSFGKRKNRNRPLRFFNPLVFREGGGQEDENKREGEGKKSKRDFFFFFYCIEIETSSSSKAK